MEEPHAMDAVRSGAGDPGRPPRLLQVPRGLAAPGTADPVFHRVLPLDALPPGALRRVTVGDLDVLVVHTPRGLVATDDRCPHMAAPLSLGTLDGCVVSCPLHQGRFDLATGTTVQFPTTGGLDADGVVHPPRANPAASVRPEVPDHKARVRAATRVRRLRYYPLRIADGWLELGLPAG